ncbi:unnamed protein product [Rhodiola kirilowii]
MSSGRVVVLDNGAATIKAGFGGGNDPKIILPNYLIRPLSSKKWIFPDPSIDLTSAAIRRPFDRGQLINADLQREIWSHLFSSPFLNVTPSTSTLLLTQPLFALPSLQRAVDEIVFEDFGFKAMYVADSPALAWNYEANLRPDKLNCGLVVDCGFSFTHAAPVFQNFTVNYGVKRMDLGGKALTNYLKELVSYRAVNVMDETLIMDDVKEKLCFVSLDVTRDLQIARRPGRDNLMRCTYVLPDGITHTKGYVKDQDEARRYLDVQKEASILVGKDEVRETQETKLVDRRKVDLTKNEFNLTNERFVVPEMIFRPADLGMNQAGLAECIVRAVNSCHPYLHPVLYESIFLTGGSTLFPQFAERLERDLLPLVPDNYQVKITIQEDPIRGVWRGGSLLASNPNFESMCVTKAEYEELGSARCHKRFFHC